MSDPKATLDKLTETVIAADHERRARVQEQRDELWSRWKLLTAQALVDLHTVERQLRAAGDTIEESERVRRLTLAYRTWRLRRGLEALMDTEQDFRGAAARAGVCGTAAAWRALRDQIIGDGAEEGSPLQQITLEALNELRQLSEAE
jgi:hypothetical protein